MQRREKTRGQQRTREKVGMREESRSEKRWSSPLSSPRIFSSCPLLSSPLSFFLSAALLSPPLLFSGPLSSGSLPLPSSSSALICSRVHGGLSLFFPSPLLSFALLSSGGNPISLPLLCSALLSSSGHLLLHSAGLLLLSSLVVPSLRGLILHSFLLLRSALHSSSPLPSPLLAALLMLILLAALPPCPLSVLLWWPLSSGASPFSPSFSALLCSPPLALSPLSSPVRSAISSSALLSSCVPSPSLSVIEPEFR